MPTATWEEAVDWYRDLPDNERAVRDNYFDLPVLDAVERYRQSEEFAEVLRILGQGEGRSVLDLGAGNGIASYALAKHGWQVTALEPDPSDEVGAGAIEHISQSTKLPITVVQDWGEKLPFADASFDTVHARQVLHHAQDLEAMLSEISRVLRPQGMLLTTRDHVVDDEAQLAAFRANHPLHHLYQGENAFPLARYQNAFLNAGLRIKETWSPLASVLNFYPGTERERQITLRAIAYKRYFRLGRLLAWSGRFLDAQVQYAARHYRSPGRIYSFLGEKP